MPRRFSLAAKGALLALLLQGCTQWQYDIGRPLAEQAVPATGDATRLAQVLAEFGPPDRISSTTNGYVMAWEYWQIRENAIGFSLGFVGADFFAFDWGEAEVSGQFLLLSFDREHRLLTADLAVVDNAAGGGTAIQPFFGIVDVVDVDDITERMPQHDWGRAVLLPPLEAINNASRPEMGDTGIEQRGTPKGVGQRALEMD